MAASDIFAAGIAITMELELLPVPYPCLPVSKVSEERKGIAASAMPVVEFSAWQLSPEMW